MFLGAIYQSVNLVCPLPSRRRKVRPKTQSSVEESGKVNRSPLKRNTDFFFIFFFFFQLRRPSKVSKTVLRTRRYLNRCRKRFLFVLLEEYGHSFVHLSKGNEDDFLFEENEHFFQSACHCQRATLSIF